MSNVCLFVAAVFELKQYDWLSKKIKKIRNPETNQSIFYPDAKHVI